jgi:hypothetical protein
MPPRNIGIRLWLADYMQYLDPRPETLRPAMELPGIRRRSSAVWIDFVRGLSAAEGEKAAAGETVVISYLNVFIF